MNIIETLLELLPAGQLKNFLKAKQDFFTFLAVGGFTAVIYFSSFALLWQLLSINYKLSVSLSYSLSVLFHFTINRSVTFKAHGANLVPHVMKYACMVGINYVVTLLVMSLVVELFHLSPYAGVMLSILVNTYSNFLMSRYWVFRIA